MKPPRITIVTPSFNQGAFLERTIRSVLDQEYPNLEYIVMDGGSTDQSAEIIRRYEDKLAYWVSRPDGGQTAALIEGFRRSTGDIQGWLCSDDLLEPGSLTEVANFFENNPKADVVYGNSYWMDVADRPIGPKKEHPFSRFIWLHAGNYLPQPSTFWRRSLYEKVGGLDPQFDLAMDADLWIRFSDVGHIYHVPRVWSGMRSYPEQKNQRLRTKSDEEGARIHARYGRPASRVRRFPGLVTARGLRIAWKAVTGCYRF